MTKQEIIKKAIKNGEIALDVAGQILLNGCSKEVIDKAIKNNEISVDLAGQILLAQGGNQ